MGVERGSAGAIVKPFVPERSPPLLQVAVRRLEPAAHVPEVTLRHPEARRAVGRRQHAFAHLVVSSPVVW